MSEPKQGVNRGNAGKGRPKGSRNKMTTAIKEMVVLALDKAGGVEYLLEQSKSNPTAFLTLVGKVLPLQVEGSGEAGEFVTRIEIVAGGNGEG